MNKFKIVVEVPGASFAREFATLKSLTQYKRRNPNLKGIEYIFHNSNWERFVIHGSQLIPEPILHTLLSSLNSSISFEAPNASPKTNQTPAQAGEL